MGWGRREADERVCGLLWGKIMVIHLKSGVLRKRQYGFSKMATILQKEVIECSPEVFTGS